MDILIACEYSGLVRDAFIAKGHNAVSCDILPTESPGPHIQDDVLKHLNGWDAIIAFPPCTDLSNVNTFRLKEKIADGRTQRAVDFVVKIWESCDTVAIENPIGYLSKWRHYDQLIEPWYFGHNYKKRTCLWLKNLPPLLSTIYCEPTNLWVDGGPRRKNNLPSLHRDPKKRSKFHPGIAAAMADQWLTTPKYNNL